MEANPSANTVGKRTSARPVEVPKYASTIACAASALHVVALLPASICARRTSAKTAKRCSSANTTACGVLAGSVQEISAHIENRERSAGSARPRMPCVCCAPRLWLVGPGPDLVCLCLQRPQWPLCASVVYSQFFFMRLCLFLCVCVPKKYWT